MKTSSRVGVLMLSIRYGIFGGVELGAKRVRDWLVKNGISMYVVAAGKSKDIYRVPTFWLRHIFWPLFAYIWGITIILFNKIDVIYARYATYPLFVGVILKFISGKPLVVSIHGGDIRHRWPLKYFINLCLGRCDAVVCYDNPGHIEELKGRGIHPIVIENGIDTREFKPKSVHSKTKKVIYVGGTRSIKGWDDILSLIYSDEFDNLVDFSFNLYGWAETKGSVNRVFHSRAEHKDMPGILETGQLFILPSYAEGVPGAMLEAMSKGMFIIASDIDFTRKVLDKKFLFKAGDLERMRYLILKFYSDKKRYFGNQDKKNRKIIVDNYSIESSGKKWKTLILDLAKGD